MKINNFRGDLTDISAKKEALASMYVYVYAKLGTQVCIDFISE